MHAAQLYRPKGLVHIPAFAPGSESSAAFSYFVLYSMPAAGKLSVWDSVPAAAKLA